MAMGRQDAMLATRDELPSSPRHAFYDRLQAVLVEAGFDRFVETLCRPFHVVMGAPPLPPGRYFRMLLIGYFEGLDSERELEWRSADSLSLRAFLGLGPRDRVPDHAWLSRTRARLTLEVHEAVFAWVLERLAERGLVEGGRIRSDASTMEANAAIRSLRRRDTGEGYREMLTSMARASGIATPTAAGCAPMAETPAEPIVVEDHHGRTVLKDLHGGPWQTRVAEPPGELAALHPGAGTRVALKGRLERFGLLGPALRVHSALRTRGWFRWVPLVPEQEFSATCDLAIATLLAHSHAFGDYLEFGVSRGTSMTCMYRALRKAGLSSVRLIGFDSFKGMPNEAAGQGWAPGLYASSRGATRRHLNKAGVDLAAVRLVKGWFRDTLTPKTVARLELQKASLIMVDCDIYTASKQALLFCEPLIADRAVIIFDDWGARADVGEIGQQEAYAEFLEAFPHFTSESLPAHIPQARMFLVTRRAAMA